MIKISIVPVTSDCIMQWNVGTTNFKEFKKNSMKLKLSEKNTGSSKIIMVQFNNKTKTVEDVSIPKLYVGGEWL
jgi:hypothetical protein